MQKPRMERYLHEVERAVGTYSSSEAPARQRERRLVQRIRENDMAHGEDLLPHSLRVGVLYLLMVDIVKTPLPIPGEYREPGVQGAVFHDVGKIYLDPGLLKKRGKLSEPEKAAVAAHTDIGRRVIEETAPSLHPVVGHIVAHHHNIVNGTYASRKGISLRERKERRTDEIEAHVVRAVEACDIWDAVRRARPYKGEFTTQESRQEIVGKTAGRKTSRFWRRLADVLVETDGETFDFFVKAGLYDRENLVDPLYIRRLMSSAESVKL